MPDSPYAHFLPPILTWIRETLDAYEPQKRTVESFGFQRLPEYFCPNSLYGTYVVITDSPPVPPLSAWGLSEFAWIETPPRALGPVVRTRAGGFPVVVRCRPRRAWI